MAFEDYKAPEESGSGAENKKAPDVMSDKEELKKMGARIEELQASGDNPSEEEVAELGEIIARGDEIIAAYERQGYGQEDGEDGLSAISLEVAELMRRGRPYTPEEIKLMEAEAERLEEKVKGIFNSIQKDYEFDDEEFEE